MTALAVAEAEIAAKRALPGVAGRAALRARRRKVLGCSGRTHLLHLRGARSEFVAIGTCESLARAVVSVAERVSISARIRAGRAIRFLIVTHAARRDLSSGV